MKKLWMMALLTAVAAGSQAQMTNTTAKIKDTTEVFRKNSVKMNLSSLAFKSLNFSYERALGRKVTFVAGYNTMPKTVIGNLGLAKKVADRITESSGSDITNDLNKIAVQNNALTGEFRFYGGKKSGAQGFYLSLYGRYNTLKVDYDYDYVAADNQSYKIPLKTNLKGFGGGLMFGSQWLIGKRVTLDWYIIGGHYGKLTGTGIGTADLSRLSAGDKENLKAKIEEFIVVKNKPYTTASVTDQGVDLKANGPLIGIRGLGFNLGIAF